MNIVTAGDPFTDDELQIFEHKYLSSCKQLSEMVRKKKELEDQEATIKRQLQEVMDKYDIKSMDNEYIRFTRTEETKGKQTVDLELLKEEEPELYEELQRDYPKTTGSRKATIRFEVK